MCRASRLSRSMRSRRRPMPHTNSAASWPFTPTGRTARDAVRAGADSIEHATDMDDQTITEMARRGAFYVPTIDHNRYYVEYRRQFGYGEEVAARLNDYIQRNLETARRAQKAGVRFAMGSDAVF